MYRTCAFTLVRTNISPHVFETDVPFPKLDMLVPWSLPFHVLTYGISSQKKTCQISRDFDVHVLPSRILRLHLQRRSRIFRLRNFNRNLNPLMASRHPGNKTPRPRKAFLIRDHGGFKLLNRHIFSKTVIEKFIFSMLTEYWEEIQSALEKVCH